MASNPFQQLDVYWNISRKNKKLKDCYRLLYHKELWNKAYTNLYPNTNIDEKIIENIIERLRHGTYRFSPIRQKTKASQLNFQDRLMFEVLNMMLQKIYEPIFSEHSHCSIKNRNYHTALLDIKDSWRGITWCIHGEIGGNWSPIHFQILLNLLGQKIEDRRFLLLIHDALKCGVLNGWNINETQTSNFSKLLLNIYLHEFDSFIEYHLNIKHVRFANSFVIGIVGTKESARKIQFLIREFLMDKLHLSEEKTLITHIEKEIPFLGYEFTLNKQWNQSIMIKIPAKSIQTFASKNGYGNLQNFTVEPRRKLTNLSDTEILLTYNKELEIIANYYKLADNFHILNKLFYLAERSFLKTIAFKRRSTSKKVAMRMRRYQQGRLCLVQHKQGNQIVHTFLKLKDLKK